MSMGICNMCNRKGCKVSLRFDSSLTECSAFIGDAAIDWEQRRYEIAKDILVVLLTKPHAMCDNLYEEAVSHADSLIKQLKK